MIIEFRVVLNNTDKANKLHIEENTKAILVFATQQHITEKSYDTICRIVKSLLINKQQLTNETKLLKRIIQHNSNNVITDDKQKQIDTELLMLEQAIQSSTQYANNLYEELCMKQNANMN